MSHKCYRGAGLKAVMTTHIFFLILAVWSLTAYGADEIAVGARNFTYYYDPQKMEVDQQGRLVEKTTESSILANSYASQFAPSSQEFDYNIGTILSKPGEITVYVSKSAARDNNVMIVVSGHGIVSPNINNKPAEYMQFQSLAKAGEGRQLPYHIWNLGKLTDDDSGWRLSFNNEKGEYYEKTIRVDNITQDCQLWGFIDNDYDFYYSNNDVLSSDINSARYLIRPIKLMKDYDGPYELHELPITTASFPPYLTINGDTLTPIADDTTDVLIDLYSSTTQTWYLLGEYAGFKDRNRLGYYTDIDTGRNINLVFSGPRQAPYVATTSITRPIIGLWFHNDVNANLIFDGEDSWLLSQRYLTSGSAANEHQWFKVYDVRAYKGLGVSYVFHTATEGNWTGTGNYDYLVFCDDDHTASDWDHNDMIFGLLCNRPPVAVCHNDTTITQCSFSQIAIHGFSASDPDYNLSTVYAVGGTFAGDSIRFTPTAAGTYSLKLIATDTYGLADTCETKVTVVLNSAPDAQSPADTTIHQGGLTLIKLPGFRATDPDNNITSLTVNTGTLHGDTLWFTPVAGLNVLKIIATDACGLKDSSITNVTVIINQAPILDPIGPKTVYEGAHLQFVVTSSDPDGDFLDLSAAPLPTHAIFADSGNGHGLFTFDPDYTQAGVYYVLFIVKERTGLKLSPTGLADSELVQITVLETNRPPVAVCHGDTTMFRCNTNAVAVHGYSASDPDGNLANVYAIGGTFAGDSVVVTPSGPGVNNITIKLVAVDSLGAADTCETHLTITVNRPPVAVSPPDTSLFRCDASEICIPGFTASDPDGNLAGLEIQGCYLKGDSVCMAATSGTHTLILIATDSCGAADTSITNVTITLNQDPMVNTPADTTIFQCNLTQIKLPGFWIMGPDNNITTVTVSTGTLHGDTLWFMPVAGLNTIKVVATDSCGLKDSSITRVTVNLNTAPDAQSPADTTIFQCSLTQIQLPGFRALDAENNITSVVVTPGTLHGDTLWFTPVAGLNTLKIVVTDACGLKDSSITRVTVNLNTAPDAQSPADTTIFQCSLTQIQLPGFRALDAENNITSVVVTPGTLHGDTLWFTPVAGLNTLKIVVTDACGLKDSSITRVTVNLNTAPDAQSPADTTIFQCSLTQIQLPGFRALDAENNITSVIVTPGTLHGDTLWFTPVAGLNTLKIVVTDACGLKDSSITSVTVTVNSAPDAQAHGDTTIFQCSITEIRLPGFRAIDVNNNIVSVTVNTGTLHGDTLWFTPVAGLNILKIIATDACGAIDSAICRVTVNINAAPDAQSPADTSFFQCSLTQIKLPGFRALDADNNITSVVVTPGTLHGDTLWFTPVAGLNTLKIVVTDACGLKDSSITRVTVNLNTAPVANCPNDTTVTYTCVPSQVCIGPYSAIDSDGNLDTAFVLPNSYGGTFNGTTYCFTPSGVGTYTIRYVARDECGAADTCATVVTVQMINRPPVANCHGDTTMTVCSLTQICLGGFTASDPDNNLSTISVTGGTLQGGGIVCFTPVVGVNTITLYAADSCGAMDTCQTRVTVILNSAPNAICAHDSVVTVDTLTQICIPGFTATDVDGNLISAGVVGAVMHGDTACFAPVLGMNTLMFIARDACGLADTCITRINVALSHIGSCPIITRPFDDTMYVCAYGDYCDTVDIIDPDGDPIIVTTTIGTLIPLINVPGHWRGLWCFDVPDSACGYNYNYSGILRAGDGLCGGVDSTIIDINILGKITVSMPDSVGLWPGVVDSFPVYIDALGDCFCLGGFTLTITYDNSIFNILDITRASLISSSEYFFVNYNPANPYCPENGSRAGAFKVTMINDLNNQIPAPPICDIPPHTPLFWVHVMARADYTYPTNFCVPICFHLCEPLNYQWNSIADLSGNIVWKTEGCLDALGSTWYLELICGNLKILSNSNVIRGDINLNNQPFEIGDVVTLANYLIDPVGYPMNIRQLVASDVNSDSIRGSIADLIFMINVANGVIVPKQSPSADATAEFNIRHYANGRYGLSLNTTVPVGGFVFEIPTNDAVIENVEINSESGLDINITRYRDYLRICAFSLEGRFIPEGETKLLSFDSDREIQPASTIWVSDNAGNLINGAMKIQLPLPTALDITAAYPNPFNSTILIECALPADDNITLKIYDIAGRLVANFAMGYQTAGYHKIAWDGTNISGDKVTTGIYFAKIESSTTHTTSEAKKLTLIK